MRRLIFQRNRMRFRCALVFVAALAASACGGVTAPSDNQTETFSGTLEPKGIKFHTFRTANSGEISPITALAPVTNVPDLRAAAVRRRLRLLAIPAAERVFDAELV
jgi:hypothetical protein